MKPTVEMLLNDSFDEEKKRVRQLLDEELNKPERSRDYDRINDLTSTYVSLMGAEDEVAQRTASGIKKLQMRFHDEKPRVRYSRKIRVMMTAGIAAVLLLVANAVTISAANQNIVSYIIEKTKHGFSARPITQEVVELPTTADDPYGIKAECAKYGLDVEAPGYLPEGFVLWKCYATEADNVNKSVDFKFHRGDEYISFYYTYLYDWNSITQIPSDHFNLEEIEVNGKPAVTSKEDGQYTLIYYDGNLEYVFASNSLSYMECDKIVSSIH